jgi:amidase
VECSALAGRFFSSGSGVATAAGLCLRIARHGHAGFDLAPVDDERITGLKPTWGRVRRARVFALAESMDYIGPMDAVQPTRPRCWRHRRFDPEGSDVPAGSVPDYLADIDGGVRGIRIGIDRRLIAAGADADMVRVTEDAATVFAGLGAQLRETIFPSPDQIVRDAVLQCAVEAAVAHESTFPARASEYGPTLTGLLQIGRDVDGPTLAKVGHRRAAFSGRVAALFREIDDLLLMPP